MKNKKQSVCDKIWEDGIYYTPAIGDYIEHFVFVSQGKPFKCMMREGGDGTAWTITTNCVDI